VAGVVPGWRDLLAPAGRRKQKGVTGRDKACDFLVICPVTMTAGFWFVEKYPVVHRLLLRRHLAGMSRGHVQDELDRRLVRSPAELAGQALPGSATW